jgi:hypothetical protein
MKTKRVFKEEEEEEKQGKDIIFIFVFKHFLKYCKNANILFKNIEKI